MLKFDKELTQCALPNCRHYVNTKYTVCEDCAKKFSLNRETGYMTNDKKILHFVGREIILKVLSVGSGETREIKVPSLFVAERLINQKYIPSGSWECEVRMEEDEIVLGVEEKIIHAMKTKEGEERV